MKIPFFRKKTTELEENNLTGLTYQDLEEAMTEMMQEASFEAELTLKRDDAGFSRIDETNIDLIPDSFRIETVKKSRVSSVTNAISKQSINLYTNFGIGTGIIFATREGKAEEILSKFWNSKENRNFTSMQGQHKLSSKLLANGEMFIALSVGSDNSVKIRTIDNLEVIAIANDPDDKETPRFYIRKFVDAITKKEKQLIYRDWLNTDNSPGVTKTGKTVRGASNRRLPVIYHVNLQGIGSRGFPLLTAQLKWTEAHLAFMRSRIAIQQALARIAKRVKAKGGSKRIEALKSQAQSTLASTGSTVERNPAPAYGSTEFMNTAVDIQNVKQETGAQAANIDGAMLIAMAGAAVGIFPHYFGFGESFRLATATAMEQPMLKCFLAYSKIWIDIWSFVFDFVLETNGVGDKDRFVDVDTPEIFPRDVGDAVESLKTTLEAFPEFRESKEVQKLALMYMGLNNVDNIINNLEEIIGEDGINNETGVEDVPESMTARYMEKQVAKKLHKLLKDAGKAKKNGTVNVDT